jgi:hypothetical protein
MLETCGWAGYGALRAAGRDEPGRHLAIHNGYRQGRTVLTSAGAVQVTAQRVNDKRTDPVTGSWAPTVCTWPA